MAFSPLSFALAKGYMLAALTVCPLPDAIPKVNVYFFAKPTVYVTEAPLKALTASALKDVKDKPPEGYVVYSLTETKLSGGSVRVGLNSLKDKDGNTCISVDQVDMAIQYAPTTFIAKELQDFPCHLKDVRAREDNHVAIDKKTVADFVPKIKMEFLWHLRSLGVKGPFTAAEAPQEQDKISKGITAAADPIIKKMAKTRNERHSAATSAENIGANCADERELLFAVAHEAMRR